MPEDQRPPAGDSEAPLRSPDLDGVLAGLQIDPNDPLSVQAAVREMERAIDAKLAPYGLNPDVQAMAESRKQVYREALLERVRTDSL